MIQARSIPVGGAWIWLVVCACLASWPLTPSAARAEDGTGFEAGLRLGYGIPLGKVSDPGDDLDQGIASVIPLWLDVGYRASPEFLVGVYGQYGIGSVGDTFDASCGGLDCSATDTRLGAQVHYHFMPDAGVDPWLGLGFGYEWMTLAFSGPGGEISTTTSGFELVDFQLGVDHRVGEHVYLGAFMSLSLGQYADVSIDCSGAASATCDSIGDGSINDKALHEWLMFGVRGGYVP